MSMAKDAAAKLRKEEKEGVYGKHEAAMKSAVLEKLTAFCEQNEEFAEAVLQGGSFGECMKAVAKGVGQSISDLDAYKRAVGFYFKGADVEMTLRIRLAGDPEKPAERKAIVLDLEDFL